MSVSFQMSELSQYDDGSNVLTHPGGVANRKKRGRRPLDYPDEKGKVIYPYINLVYYINTNRSY